MSSFLKKIIRKTELQRIFQIEENANALPLGTISTVQHDQLIEVMNLWTRRIDFLKQLDMDCNKQPTAITHKLNTWRGFTYSEFAAIFNPNITPDQFAFYAAFNQIRIRGESIKTEKQRSDFMLNYSYDAETFGEVLRTSVPLLLAFFFEFSELRPIIKLEYLRQHTHILAPSGHGKSQLMRAIFYELQKKFPTYTQILIDPHGELAQYIKNSPLTYEQRERLVYINPTFREQTHTPVFNVFELGNRHSKKELTQTCEAIFSAFEEVLSKEAGKKLSEVMTNALEKCLYFMLQKEGATLIDLIDLLSGEETICQEAYEYDNYFNEQWRKPSNKTREGLFGRISRLINSPVLKMFLTGRSTFDLERAVNSGSIIVLDIGDCSELSQILIGKLFVSAVKSIVRKRQKHHKNNTPVFMFIDECHTLVSGSFEYILSQLRGFGLHLILAHQNISQLTTNQLEAIRQNTAIKILAGSDMDEIKKVSKRAPKELVLKKYEWILDMRHTPFSTFFAPAKMVKNPRKYTLKEILLENYDEEILTKTYKRIDQEKLPERPHPKPVEEENTINPPFDLLLKIENDD